MAGVSVCVATLLLFAVKAETKSGKVGHVVPGFGSRRRKSIRRFLSFSYHTLVSYSLCNTTESREEHRTNELGKVSIPQANLKRTFVNLIDSNCDVLSWSAGYRS
jgi:hypothetical protein